jgi:hypothetical protein
MKRRALSIAIGIENAMWILILEALVALGMLLLIVWLTMGGSKRRDAEAARKDAARLDPPDEPK